MIKNIFLLGSTGSIGESTLRVIKRDMGSFNIKLLTTNNNIRKIYKQAIEFKVKNVVIFDKRKYQKNHLLFKKKK